MAAERLNLSARLELRLDAKTKRAIARAAKTAGVPSADWIRGVCNRALGPESNSGKPPKAVATRKTRR